MKNKKKKLNITGREDLPLGSFSVFQQITKNHGRVFGSTPGLLNINIKITIFSSLSEIGTLSKKHDTDYFRFRRV